MGSLWKRLSRKEKVFSSGKLSLSFFGCSSRSFKFGFYFAANSENLFCLQSRCQKARLVQPREEMKKSKGESSQSRSKPVWNKVTNAADNPDDPQLSTEDLAFLLSNTHYRYLPVLTLVNATDLSIYMRMNNVHLAIFSSKQELKAWYKGFKRDCPRAQLSREKVFPFISPHLLTLLYSLKTKQKKLDWK